MKTIAIDFDGVISKYDGWKGKGVFGEPISGVSKALQKLKDRNCNVMIYTTRLETYLVEEFLLKHSIPFDMINYNPENAKQHLHPSKMLADVYIDDRGITFCGQWTDEFVDCVLNFKPWWKI